MKTLLITTHALALLPTASPAGLAETPEDRTARIAIQYVLGESRVVVERGAINEVEEVHAVYPQVPPLIPESETRGERALLARALVQSLPDVSIAASCADADVCVAVSIVCETGSSYCICYPHRGIAYVPSATTIRVLYEWKNRGDSYDTLMKELSQHIAEMRRNAAQRGDAADQRRSKTK